MNQNSCSADNQQRRLRERVAVHEQHPLGRHFPWISPIQRFAEPLRVVHLRRGRSFRTPVDLLSEEVRQPGAVLPL